MYWYLKKITKSQNLLGWRTLLCYLGMFYEHLIDACLFDPSPDLKKKKKTFVFMVHAVCSKCKVPYNQ